MRTLQDRIMDNTKPHEDGSDCIQWTGTFSKGKGKGNPVIVVDGKTKQVRRVLYEMFREPMPARSLFVLTRCGKGNCVHPEHLYLAQAAHAPSGLIAGRKKAEGALPDEYNPGDLITAAGESKTLEQWLDDPRVTASRATLRARLYDKERREAARAAGRDQGENKVRETSWATMEKLLFTPPHKRATKAEMFQRSKQEKKHAPPMTMLSFIALRARRAKGEDLYLPEPGLFDSLTKGEDK